MLGFDVVPKTGDEVTSYLRESWLGLCQMSLLDVQVNVLCSGFHIPVFLLLTLGDLELDFSSLPVLTRRRFGPGVGICFIEY